MPAAASAAWGTGGACTRESHCYAQVEWNSEGRSVYGVFSEIYTEDMKVPNYWVGWGGVEYETWDEPTTYPVLVSNEEAMNGAGGAWVEGGVVTSGTTEERMHPFVAINKPYAEGFVIFIANEHSILPNSHWNAARVENIGAYPGHQYEWCATSYDGPTGGEGEWTGCWVGFEERAHVIQVFMEASDSSEPENRGTVETEYQSTLGGSYNYWPQAAFEAPIEAFYYVSPAIREGAEAGCAEQYYSHPGEVRWGLPKTTYPC